MSFVTRRRAEAPDVMAPDGSEVRILAATGRGSMALFTLPPGAVSVTELRQGPAPADTDAGAKVA